MHSAQKRNDLRQVHMRVDESKRLVRIIWMSYTTFQLKILNVLIA